MKPNETTSKKSRKIAEVSSIPKVENSNNEYLEQEFSVWLEAIRSALGGRNSDLANALTKNWPDSDYSRRQVGLPSSNSFLQTIRTWFQNRRTLPNNTLKSDRYGRPGVLESLQELIDEKLREAPSEATSGLTFTNIVDTIREQRERNSNRNKDFGSIDEELFNKGTVSIKPVKVAKISEQDLLLGASEFQGEVPPYCSRDVDAQIQEKLNADSCNPVIVVGPPKSGKTRTLIENLKKSKHANAKIYWLEPGGGNAKSLLERTTSSSGTDVLVLDDLQNPRYFGEGGLDSKLIEDLASNFKIVGTLHENTKFQWELNNIDHRSEFSDKIVSTPNRNVQTILLRNQISLSSELSDSELDKVTSKFNISKKDVTSYRYLGSKLASVSSLSKILEHELASTDSFSHALFDSLVDSKIIFPQGATLDELKLFSKIKLENSFNSPWTDLGWESAVERFTRGLSPKSPHAIMMRTISDRTKFTLFDPIWESKRPSSWDPSHLIGLDLDFIEIADNAFELGFKEATFQLLETLDSTVPEIQFQHGRFYFLDGNFDESFKWLVQAADSQHHKALDYLGDLYYEHFEDSIKAVECWVAASELGNVWAMDSLGDFYSEQGQILEAEKWWAKASNQDNHWAMASLGDLYIQEQRIEEGLELLKNSANKENPWAMRKLGFFYEGQEDTIQAEQWWAKAADHNDDISMDKLGDLAKDSKDLVRAESWWERAAALGNSWAMASLGLLKRDSHLYEQGDELLLRAANLGNSWAMRQIALAKEASNDLTGAEPWFARAAELDDEVSIFRLGFWAMERKDDLECREWFERGMALEQSLSFRGMGILSKERGFWMDAETYWLRAADLSDHPSMDYLGDLFEEQENLGEAEKWWTKAAIAGNAHSMYSLGWLSRERSEIGLAQEWWTKAANLGHPQSMFQVGELAANVSDDTSSEIWWEKAAAFDEEWSIFKLGRRAMGNDDLDAARKWFEKGILLNQSLSYRGMGFLQWELQNLDGAKTNFERAAELEDDVSMDALGDVYEEQDEMSFASHWWKKAAEQGNSASMYSLGWLSYDNGEKTPAKGWWEKAAAADHAAAMYLLGELESEIENDKLAEEWWVKASSLGDQDSMISLHYLHKEQNSHVEGLKWLEMCGEAGNEEAMTLLIDYCADLGNKELSELWTERLEEFKRNN